MEKRKEAERRVILWRQDLSKGIDGHNNVIKRRIMCAHSSLPCQACEQSQQEMTNQSVQQTKSVEMDNKFNLVNPTKAPKGIDSNDETEIEMSCHNIYEESVIDSEGNTIPLESIKVRLVNHAKASKVEKQKEETPLIATIIKCNSEVEELSDKEGMKDKKGFKKLECAL